jgi:DNA topoisomerase-2
LDIPGFLQQFITPIVKVTKGKKSETFFTIPQYEEWKEETGNNGKGWKIKYYKGLGTSTAADAKEYFSNLDLHEVEFERISLDVKEEEEVAVAIDPLEFDGQETKPK